MFGLGMPEILLILALALIIIGPKKLPDLAKTLGKAMGEFKNAAQDFKNSINIESSIADMDPPAEEIQKNIKDANKKLAEDAKGKENKKDADFDTDDKPAEPGDNPVNESENNQNEKAEDKTADKSKTDPKKDTEK